MMKHLKIAVPVLLVVCLLGTLYALRTPIAVGIIDRLILRAQSSFGVSIGYQNFRFQGLLAVYADSIGISAPSIGVKIETRRVGVKLSLRSLLRFRIEPKSLSIDTLSIVHNSELSQRVAPAVGSFPSAGFSKSGAVPSSHMSFLLDVFTSIADTEVSISSFRFDSRGGNGGVSVQSKPIRYRNNEFRTEWEITRDSLSTPIYAHLVVNPKTSSLALQSIAGNPRSNHYPFNFLGFRTSFDTLYFNFNLLENKPQSILFQCASQVAGLRVLSSKLAESEVHISSIGLNLGVSICPNSITLDSTSMARVNTLSLPFTASVGFTQGVPRFCISSAVDSVPATDLFGSIPNGLFERLVNVDAQGVLSLSLNSCLDFANPDSLQFHIKLHPINFRLISTGQLDLYALIDSTFTHVIYEGYDTLLVVGLHRGADGFWPLHRISDVLVNAVVAAEDGGFFTHRGFDPDGFRYAMIRNVKERRLGRGGSTITMQLVKNIYLHRGKTLARKAEEALIVWLIETQRIADKSRILELYLNVIEWGPNVYGIDQAAQFYFAKTPDALDINEALFLASIIPSPGSFAQHFDTTASLSPYLQEQLMHLAGILAQRGHIQAGEYATLYPGVVLSGVAMQHLQLQGANQP